MRSVGKVLWRGVVLGEVLGRSVVVNCCREVSWWLW